jgi:UDP-N-acetylglucosamine 2-epimerase (non-hydrolysing)/GDP/UDP-N,N'-diacetylbacillosamine 2-epimerase (hydrolysing)
LLFSQHSIATEFDRAADQVAPSLEALEEAAARWNCQAILTYPNDDAGGRRIRDALDRFVTPSRGFAQLHPSLGRSNFHGALNIAAAYIGNSSAGIKETAAFHCPTVNVGPRQRGRLRGKNVIDTEYDRRQIVAAIDRCLHDPVFRAELRSAPNPYGAGDAGPRIAETLATIPLDSRLVQKKMTY